MHTGNEWNAPTYFLTEGGMKSNGMYRDKGMREIRIRKKMGRKRSTKDEEE
jgi:hypothetical protein